MKKQLALLIVLTFLTYSLMPATSSAATINTGNNAKVLVYYSTPQGVNGVWDDTAAARVFAQYDYVVFGGSIANPSDGYYPSTVNIINKIHGLNPNTKVFGYVDLGVKTNNYPMSTLQVKIDMWKTMGVNGIFLDDAGYDFYVPRTRLNDTLDYIHGKGLSAVVNAWNPDDVMGNAVDSVYNPNGASTHIGARDFYFMESFLVNTKAYANTDHYALLYRVKRKADKAVQYRKALGVKLLSINIVDYSIFSGAQIDHFFKMAETAALIYSLDGYGMSGINYGTSGPNYRVVRSFNYRPDYNNYYTTDVSTQANSTKLDTSLTEIKRLQVVLHSQPGTHWYLQ